LLILLGLALTATAQNLSVPLPPGCTPALNNLTVTCGGTTPPPVCAPTPPVCPGEVPAGCAPCTPPPEPPAVSCGDLRIRDGGEFTFDPQTTRSFALGSGLKEIYITRYTAKPSDSGKRSMVNFVEHGSGIHAKTLWVSKTKCLMDPSTIQGSNSSPSASVSVNGTQRVNMAPGETWYFMLRNVRNKNGEWANTCSDSGGCGELMTAYMWQAARMPNTPFQFGAALPKRDLPKKK